MKIVHKLSNSAELVKIGAFIKAERNLLGQTRNELADASGVSLGTLERIENGHNTRVSTLFDVIGALGYDYEDALADFFADTRDYAQQRDSGEHLGEEP